MHQFHTEVSEGEAKLAAIDLSGVIGLPATRVVTAGVQAICGDFAL